MTAADVLAGTVQALLAPGRGLLAADESLPTIARRFQSASIAATAEHRRAYRELLFTTPGLSEFISGVILFDETLRQPLEGAPMAAALTARGMVPGIKVDLGATPLAGLPGEKFTQGLDGLRVRLASYRELGARFTKWRAVLAVGDGLPTDAAIAANAQALAIFAALSQEAGLVPIVEPEVLMDGAHSLDRAEAVGEAVLRTVFDALARHCVALEGMILKTAMVLPGVDCPQKAGAAEVAAASLRCLRRSVPAAVPGIVFLSGGQGEREATERLGAICAVPGAPWRLTFSFGRALQDSALETWRGDPARAAAAQAALALRARCNGLAVRAQPFSGSYLRTA
jgi:fructose-bisphosphate aldolase class I